MDALAAAVAAATAAEEDFEDGTDPEDLERGHLPSDDEDGPMDWMEFDRRSLFATGFTSRRVAKRNRMIITMRLVGGSDQ